MSFLPFEIIEYIGKYIVDLNCIVLVNKEYYHIFKKEKTKRYSTVRRRLLTILIDNKINIIKKNNIFYNVSELMDTGIYKLYSYIREHNHLFITLDRYQSYKCKYTSSNSCMFEFCLVNIQLNLVPGYISFERYKR